MKKRIKQKNLIKKSQLRNTWIMEKDEGFLNQGKQEIGCVVYLFIMMLQETEFWHKNIRLVGL